MRNFYKILNKIAQFFRKIVEKNSSKFADPKTKKIASPAQIKRIFMVGFFSVFMTIVVLTFFGEDSLVGGGLGNFNKQKGVKFGVTKYNISDRVNPIDPLDQFQSTVAEGPETMCSNLHEKVKAGERLKSDEYVIFKKCIAENTIPGLTIDQKNALDALANPDSDLTDKERELLAGLANGTINPNSEEGRLARALVSDDPFERAVARKILDPNTSDEERRLLTGYLNGEVSKDVAQGLMSADPEVRKAAIALNKAIKEGNSAEVAKLKGVVNESRPTETKSPENQSTAAQIESAIQALPEAVKNEIEATKIALDDAVKAKADLDQEIGRLAEKYQEAESRRERGESLSKNDAELISDYQRKSKESELLDDQIEQMKGDIKRVASNANFELGRAYGDYNRKSEEVIEEFSTEKKPAPIKKQTISPSEYKLLMALKKKNEMSDDYEKSLFPNTPTSQFNTKEMQAVAMSSEKLPLLKNYNLPSDLMIPCESENDLMLTSEQKNLKFTCRMLDNVYNPENNQILFAKGSKAFCVTGTFDVNTKLLDVSCTKVRSGNKSHDVGLLITDFSGKQGIPGGVLRTRNKKVTAAVLMDFAAGFTQFFSQYAQQQMLQNGVNSLNLGNSATGAGFQALSTGISKVAETISQDLQNSPDIFFSPAGMKLFLTPAL